MRVGVVGAGWSGLAVATFLQARGHDVDVFEAAADVGGRIRTHQDEEGYLIEAGPHGVIPASAATRHLLDVADVPLLEAPARAPRHVVHRGRPHALPATPRHLLATRLLSAPAKLRLLREPFVPAGPPGESVASFARRRFGRGVAPLVDAFVTGVYGGDPERLVLQHAFPELHRMDRHGGVLRSLRQERAPRPPLTAPREGMAALVRALARRLRVHTSMRVESVSSGAKGAQLRAGGTSHEMDRVVLALDPARALELLRVRAGPPPTAPMHVVAFGVAAERSSADGYGVLAPEQEGAFILGALYESSLFADRAPPAHALLRCLVGGRRRPGRATLDRDLIAEQAWRDLVKWGIVEGEPVRTFHLPTPGIPQPEAGHAAWLDALRHERIDVLGIGSPVVGLDRLAVEAERLATRMG